MYFLSPVRMWRERGRRGAWARFSCIEPGRKSIQLQFWIDGLYSKKGYKFQQKFERNIERLRNTFTANGRNNNLAKIFLLCACRFYVKMSSFHKSKNDCALYEIMEMIIFWGNKYGDETFVVCIKALCIFLNSGWISRPRERQKYQAHLGLFINIISTPVRWAAVDWGGHTEIFSLFLLF